MNKIILEYYNFIKEIISKLAYENDLDNLDDLQNDIVIILYEQEAKVLELYKKGELKYFIVAIINNQIRSTNSPYYKMYKKLKTKSISLEDYERTDENTGDDDC